MHGNYFITKIALNFHWKFRYSIIYWMTNFPVSGGGPIL